MIFTADVTAQQLFLIFLEFYFKNINLLNFIEQLFSLSFLFLNLDSKFHLKSLSHLICCLFLCNFIKQLACLTSDCSLIINIF